MSHVMQFVSPLWGKSCEAELLQQIKQLPVVVKSENLAVFVKCGKNLWKYIRSSGDE